ncbi:MAG TPA: hypothetical protein VK689_00295, partial [Armatimonadota bacterium]|nr:hypothetical protein [Armatimonadota bacterium]
TIRDVEFTVQVLQLLFGAEFPALQAPDTATAIQRLEDTGLLVPEEGVVFTAGYAFFRAVEHRLQLLHDLPVRLLPEDSVDLRRLARSMGYADTATFCAAYREHRERVRELAEAIHDRLGIHTSGSEDALRPALLRADTPEGEGTLRVHLAGLGLAEVEAALGALRRLASGSPHAPHPASTRRLFADLAPALLQACADAADPVEALRLLADFADRKLLYRALYQTLLEHPDSLRTLCRFAGAAPAAMRVVLRYPELSDLVTDEEQHARHREKEELREDLERRLTAAPTHARRLGALRRFKLREYVRLAARHVLSPVPPDVETAEWSDVADVLVEGSLRVAVAALREEGRWAREDAGAFAVLALGRFGGRDLHFPSDLDLLYVFDPSSGDGQQTYELLAKAFSDVLQAPVEGGRLFALDLRLRPEGRQGYTVTSLEAARRYYGEGGRAQTWEFQMLTRLRAVAGSGGVAPVFQALLEPRIYREPMPPAWMDEIRAVKRRVERERVSDRDRAWNLKLGPGGLSDIEFLIQLLQLQHGGSDARLREPSTRGAITALAAAGHLAGEEAAALLDTHAFLTRLRQAYSLLRGEDATDTLPLADPEDRHATALAPATFHANAAALADAYLAHTRPVRELFLRRLG